MKEIYFLYKNIRFIFPYSQFDNVRRQTEYLTDSIKMAARYRILLLVETKNFHPYSMPHYSFTDDHFEDSLRARNTEKKR